jgi:hypothetical protein
VTPRFKKTIRAGTIELLESGCSGAWEKAISSGNHRISHAPSHLVPHNAVFISGTVIGTGIKRAA